MGLVRGMTMGIVATFCACNLVFGVDDLEFDRRGNGGEAAEDDDDDGGGGAAGDDRVTVGSAGRGGAGAEGADGGGGEGADGGAGGTGGCLTCMEAAVSAVPVSVPELCAGVEATNWVAFRDCTCITVGTGVGQCPACVGFCDGTTALPSTCIDCVDNADACDGPGTACGVPGL